MSTEPIYVTKPWLKHYQKGVPATVEIPLKSLPQAFDGACAPDRPAVVFYRRTISYESCARRRPARLRARHLG